MRLAGLVFLLIGMLVLASIGSLVAGREAVFSTFAESKEVEKIKSKGSTVSIAISKCKSKKAGFCQDLSPMEKNSTLGDKREVPTGPNPLHNR